MVILNIMILALSVKMDIEDDDNDDDDNEDNDCDENLFWLKCSVKRTYIWMGKKLIIMNNNIEDADN